MVFRGCPESRNGVARRETENNAVSRRATRDFQRGIKSHVFMEGAFNDFQLLLTRKAAEIDGIAGNTYGQCRILFGMSHGIRQYPAVHHVDIQVMSALGEITVQYGYKIVNTFQRRFAQGIRDDGKGIGNAVLADGPVS